MNLKDLRALARRQPSLGGLGDLFGLLLGTNLHTCLDDHNLPDPAQHPGLARIY